MFDFLGASKTIDSVGNALDKVFTSKDEVLSKEQVIARLGQESAKAQIEMNKQEAESRSLFIAGWRPFIGWTCGISLFYNYFSRPILQDVLSAYGISIILTELDTKSLMDLTTALLGLAALRTYEKLKGLTR